MEQEREKEKTDKDFNYNQLKYGSRRIYDRLVLDARTKNNFKVLESGCGISETEFKILIKNLDDIVNYITSSKEIDRKDIQSVARVIRIAYSEYIAFLSNLVQEKPVFFDKNSADRKNRSLVKHFNELKKKDILDKYLRMYEAYERNSGIDFYL